MHLVQLDLSQLSCTSTIYVSDSHNPWFNLAFEDWIFRKTDPRAVVLYMYRNDPSVIIGRNQNPWKEINLHQLNDLGIPFVRRKSGGGTVYHDLGNTNYCVFVPREQFERRINAELVARALNEVKIPANVNERNDICVEGFKVSGSAFKLVNARAYHHGTMLIDAKLGDLRGVLGTTKHTLITKGVPSVSSPVRNLVQWNSDFGHEKFVGAVSEEFKKTYGEFEEVQVTRVNESELERNEYVKGVSDELQSWDWQWGSTPEFTHDIEGSFPFGDISLHITSRHALITSASLTRPPRNPAWYRSAEHFVSLLEGDRYGTLEGVEKALEGMEGIKTERLRTLVEWLKKEM
ncbi:hypothetical protein BCR35DRAFT_108826 [Leucosporidium creatinivorum]|uniref:Putative lipoate-protein ligase A n=1 Tax=Leucosporidium creatinivorum TaxID=106004 RepID=A0A1Y2G1U6_9BASI|nr:hypothetical protein BCR35DRAFT_108826 [Leucosporidium creatinivorum]